MVKQSVMIDTLHEGTLINSISEEGLQNIWLNQLRNVDGLDKLMSSIIFMNAMNPLVMACIVNGPLQGIPSRFLFHNFVGDNLGIH